MKLRTVLVATQLTIGATLAGCSIEHGTQGSGSTESMVVIPDRIGHSQYERGRVIKAMSDVTIGSCILFTDKKVGQELYQYRGGIDDPSTPTDSFSMVFVEPIDKIDFGDLTAPHEYWFSGGRNAEYLGIDQGLSSVVECPPVIEPKTRSISGGYVEDHNGDSAIND